MFLQHRNTGSVKVGGRLIKKVSTIFKPSQRVVERGVEEGEEEEDVSKVSASASSSESSMDDIRRPSGLGPSIEEQARLVPPLPTYYPPKPARHPPIFPVKILKIILSSLPRSSVPTLALVSRYFLSCVQGLLYGELDMRNVRNLDKLWLFLVTRRDLTCLTHTLRVPAWPSSQTRTYLIPRVLARMDNLCSLTLPCFDFHVIRHHSAFGLSHIEFGNSYLSSQDKADLITWLNGQTNIVSLIFPNLVGHDDDYPPKRTHNQLVSASTIPSTLSLFPMPPLSPLPETPTPTRDAFTHTTSATLLPNLVTLHGPPHLILLFAPSRPLIDVSVTISKPIYAGFRPTTTLESLPPSVSRLKLFFKSVGKRTEEKTLKSAVVICPNIEQLDIEAKPAKSAGKDGQQLDERFPLPKRARMRSMSSTTSLSAHSIVVSERARAARLAASCPALERVVFPNGIEWRRPPPSLPTLPRSEDLFVKKMDRDIPSVHPRPPKTMVSLKEQRFVSEDDDLFVKPDTKNEGGSKNKSKSRLTF
ncbi:hypothetical protein DFS33DRAFT_1490555 [Desarmillaria ectypa]|nr:hypothetical protein DFS33DRAFT_1490555 [Desarmillaria ectypa]